MGVVINARKHAVMRDVMAALRRLDTSEEQGEVLRVVAIAMDLKLELDKESERIGEVRD